MNLAEFDADDVLRGHYLGADESERWILDSLAPECDRTTQIPLKTELVFEVSRRDGLEGTAEG